MITIGAIHLRLAYRAADRAVRIYAPITLRATGLPALIEWAEKLEALAPINSEAASNAASNASYAASDAASRAASAASYAASNASYAASRAASAASYAASWHKYALERAVRCASYCGKDSQETELQRLDRLELAAEYDATATTLIAAYRGGDAESLLVAVDRLLSLGHTWEALQ